MLRNRYGWSDDPLTLSFSVLLRKIEYDYALNNAVEYIADGA